MRHPHVLQLIMDSLRYWVLEMHVDGFRFDLAATLARELHDVDRLSAFFDLIQQDPVVSQVKLIAEPWDIGEGGYQVGNFPPLWSEWNGKYRDTVRDFWRGTDQTMAEFACSSPAVPIFIRELRATAREHQLHHRPRWLHSETSCRTTRSTTRPTARTSRDGESHNRSWNCGAEGPTDDPAILAMRARQQRNFLTTLLLSQGVPMLLGGDEIGARRAQQQRHCQDNPISCATGQRPTKACSASRAI
jgi:glycogen operon protein